MSATHKRQYIRRCALQMTHNRTIHHVKISWVQCNSAPETNCIAAIQWLNDLWANTIAAFFVLVLKHIRCARIRSVALVFPRWAHTYTKSLKTVSVFVFFLVVLPNVIHTFCLECLTSKCTAVINSVAIEFGAMCECIRLIEEMWWWFNRNYGVSATRQMYVLYLWIVDLSCKCWFKPFFHSHPMRSLRGTISANWTQNRHKQ